MPICTLGNKGLGRGHRERGGGGGHSKQNEIRAEQQTILFLQLTSKDARAGKPVYALWPAHAHTSVT